MSRIEDILKDEKLQLDQIEIPDKLEMRLRKALDRKTIPVFKRFKMQVVVLITLIVVATFNYDVIASYGKQLFGYDQVMNGTLKELTELGKGQIIGKSHTFANGVSLTVDYVMLDENQLLLFYTVKNQTGIGDGDDLKISPFMSLKGFWREYHSQGSEGTINEAKTEMKMLASFDPPLPFEKKLTLRFSQREQGREIPAEINFILDRNTAMGHTLKKNLNKTIQVDETEIQFDSILASPTKTVIKGSAQSIIGLAMDTLSGERFKPTDLTLKLIANGVEVQKQGSGMSTDMKGITFHSDFDALPPDLKDLKFELVSFGADHDVNKQFKLERKDEKQVLDILGQKVEVNEIKASNNETLITVTSDMNLVLTKIYLIIDGARIPLEETIGDSDNKMPDGTVTHKRILRFKGVGDELTLDIQRMTYSKEYNQVVEIPLN